MSSKIARLDPCPAHPYVTSGSRATPSPMLLLVECWCRSVSWQCSLGWCVKPSSCSPQVSWEFYSREVMKMQRSPWGVLGWDVAGMGIVYMLMEALVYLGLVRGWVQRKLRQERRNGGGRLARACRCW